jgi:hypothetical protein
VFSLGVAVKRQPGDPTAEFVGAFQDAAVDGVRHGSLASIQALALLHDQLTDPGMPLAAPRVSSRDKDDAMKDLSGRLPTRRPLPVPPLSASDPFGFGRPSVP